MELMRKLREQCMQLMNPNIVVCFEDGQVVV
jgi:hypothetical protein